MTLPCTAALAPDTFASGLLRYLDCQATTLGSTGYQALAAPGSTAALLIASLLTIVIALFGYRMLFGDAPDIREGVMSAVKIGLVLALASSWPAYRTLVFDVVLRAPANLAADIGGPAGLSGATGGLAGRLDAVDRAFRVLAIYGVGTPTREQVEQANGVAPPLFANFDGFALGASRVVFLVGSLGAFALVRMAAGLLLALGPLLVAGLLFTSTRGLTEGWIRGLIAAMLGSTAIAVATGIELALLEPWLAGLIGQRANAIAIPGVPTAMLATAIIFAVATAGLLALVTRVAFGLRLPLQAGVRSSSESSANTSMSSRAFHTRPADARTPADVRSRAVSIADSIAAAQRREAGVAMGRSSMDMSDAGAVRSRADTASSDNRPFLAARHRRRTTTRVSAIATNRDRTP